MDWGKIDAEREAAQSLIDLYDQAKKCQQLHERANVPIPEPLKRLLGMGEHTTKSHAARAGATISPPQHSNPPNGASSDWVSIAVSEATVSTVALAILRQAGGPMRSRDLTETVLGLLPNSTSGSVANIGTRLQGTVIDRSEDGWKLINPEAAGIITDGRLWGPPSIFTIHDLAAHRREAIIHILKNYPSGLQTVQIVEQLRNCSWVHAPINKDLLKADMESLQSDGKVRRRGNSKKWEVVREEDS